MHSTCAKWFWVYGRLYGSHRRAKLPDCRFIRKPARHAILPLGRWARYFKPKHLKLTLMKGNAHGQRPLRTGDWRQKKSPNVRAVRRSVDTRVMG